MNGTFLGCISDEQGVKDVSYWKMPYQYASPFQPVFIRMTYITHFLPCRHKFKLFLEDFTH